MPLNKPDYVYPIKYEQSSTGGTENDEIQSELDPREDCLVAKQIAFPFPGEDFTATGHEIKQRIGVDPVTYDLILEDLNAGHVSLTDLLLGKFALTPYNILQYIPTVSDAQLASIGYVPDKTMFIRQIGNYREMIWWDETNAAWMTFAGKPMTVNWIGTGPEGVYVESFETGTYRWVLNGAGSQVPFTRRSGTTPTGNTGPSGAQSGSYYVFTESTNNVGKTYVLETSYFAKPEEISFYYHMCGTGTGRLSLQSFDGSEWTELWFMQGAQHAYTYSPWSTETIDLRAVVANKLRFVVSGSTSGYADVCLDNISITSVAV